MFGRRCWLFVCFAGLLLAVGLAACGGGRVDRRITAAALAHATTVNGSVKAPVESALYGDVPRLISFANARTAFAVTGNGTLEHSSTGGRTWSAVGHHPGFMSLEFISPSRGFATTTVRPCGEICHQRVLESTDAGRHWHRIGTISGHAPELAITSLDFVTPQFATILTETGAEVSHDGGRTWSELSLPQACVLAVNGGRPGGVSFTSPEHGYAICGGPDDPETQAKALYMTRDGGAHWQMVAHTPTRSHAGDQPGRTEGTLPVLGFVDGIAAGQAGGIVVVIGDYGVVVSSDGGAHFHDGPWSVDNPPQALSWPAGGMPYLLESGGTVGTPATLAGPWHQIYPTGVGVPSGPIAFASVSDGISSDGEEPGASSAVVVGTRDGGKDWTVRGRLAAGSLIEELIAVGPRAYYALAAPNPLSTNDVLYRTEDAGRHWQKLAVPTHLGYAWSVDFVSAQVGFVLSEDGEIWRTENGTRTWRRMRGYGPDESNAVFVSKRVGLDPEGPGHLRETMDGGRHWRVIDLPRYYAAEAVSAAQGGRDWWIGVNHCIPNRRRGAHSRRESDCVGALFTSTDFGAHWRLILFRRSSAGAGDFPTGQVGYSAGPPILKTGDGGLTWHTVSAPPT